MGVGDLKDGGTVIARQRERCERSGGPGGLGGLDRRDGVTPPTNDAEAAIVARLAAGDRDALTALYVRYQRPLFAYLTLLATDRGTAEEILQDTLVAVWQCAARFEGRSSVRAWLFGIARRQAHNTLRRRALPLVGDDALAALPSPGPGPEESVLASAAGADVAAALRAVAPVHREVIVLALGEGLPYQEGADVLGVPIGTVKSRLYHAKRALRTEIERRTGEDA